MTENISCLDNSSLDLAEEKIKSSNKRQKIQKMKNPITDLLLYLCSVLPYYFLDNEKGTVNS
jgi:hypothetical protein